MNYVSDILFIAGASLVVIGVSLWSTPFGFIVCGLFVLAAAIFIAYSRKDDK